MLYALSQKRSSGDSEWDSTGGQGELPGSDKTALEAEGTQ